VHLVGRVSRKSEKPLDAIPAPRFESPAPVSLTFDHPASSDSSICSQEISHWARGSAGHDGSSPVALLVALGLPGRSRPLPDSCVHPESPAGNQSPSRARKPRHSSQAPMGGGREKLLGMGSVVIESQSGQYGALREPPVELFFPVFIQRKDAEGAPAQRAVRPPASVMRSGASPPASSVLGHPHSLLCHRPVPARV